MILVDTSVWVEHLRLGIPRLGAVLEAGAVWTHPFIRGELACGTMRRREDVLWLMSRLPTVSVASDEEALALIERRRLMGRGLGFIDVHLLASLLLERPVRLWTRDRRLAAVARDLDLLYTPA